jgi:Maf-like protein
VIAHVPSQMRVSDHHLATVHFTRALQDDASVVVDALLEQGAPILLCASGLMIEHELTQQYVDRIQGTQNSIMGISKDTVRTLLNELQTKLAAGSQQQNSVQQSTTDGSKEILRYEERQRHRGKWYMCCLDDTSTSGRS